MGRRRLKLFGSEDKRKRVYAVREGGGWLYFSPLVLCVAGQIKGSLVQQAKDLGKGGYQKETWGKRGSIPFKIKLICPLDEGAELKRLQADN